MRRWPSRMSQTADQHELKILIGQAHNEDINTQIQTSIHPLGRDGRFGSKVGQIGPKWDKSGTFTDQISVHLAQGRQMH